MKGRDFVDRSRFIYNYVWIRLDNVKGQGMARWHGDLVRVREIKKVNEVDNMQKITVFFEKKIDQRRDVI